MRWRGISADGMIITSLRWSVIHEKKRFPATAISVRHRKNQIGEKRKIYIGVDSLTTVLKRSPVKDEGLCPQVYLHR